MTKGRRKSAAMICGIVVSALTLAACGSSNSSSTTTSSGSEATFGDAPYWNTVTSAEGYWTVVYISPYWADFYSPDNGAHWQLKTPTNVSPRHGISLAESDTGTTAVGFFPYEGQQNSVIFSFNASTVQAPQFLGTSLVQTRQAVAFSGPNIFALGSTASGVQIRKQPPGALTPTLALATKRTNQTGVSAIGFSATSQSNGVALLASTMIGDSVTGVYSSTDHGSTWVPVVITSPVSAGALYSGYVAEGFGSNGYELVLTQKSSSSYQSFAQGTFGASSVITTGEPPVIGSDPLGDIYLIDNTLGATPTMQMFSAATNSWSSSVTMNGIKGAVESVGFTTSSKGMVISNLGGIPTAFVTSSGGTTWSQKGAILSPFSGG